MDLKDVKTHDDILKLYEQHKLVSTTEKINYLKNTMKIRKTHCEVKETEEEELAGLEDLALTHMWEALSN